MIKVKKIDILKFLLYIFIMIPFFEMNALNYLSNLYGKIINIWVLFSFLIILLLFLKQNRFSKYYIILFIFYLLLTISTFINSGDIKSCLSIIIKSLSLCFLFDYGIKNDKDIFLKTVEYLLFILIFLNLCSILIFPSGLYIDTAGYTQNWLLGYKNTHIMYIFPFLLVTLLRNYMEKDKISIKSIIFICVSVFSTIIVNNSTALIGLIIIIILMIFKNKILTSNFFSLKNYFITYICLFISIVILKLQNIFSFIIVDLLKKDLTFTGRTYIWNSVIELIKKKPLLGYGNNIFVFNKHILSTHNTILDILYKTGIFGMIPYLLLCLIIIKKVQFEKNKFSFIISTFLFSLFIMMLTEAYTINFYFYVFIIALNIKEFSNESR